MKKPLILIIGPTACGKTTLSVNLAQAIGGECINSDATQFFNGLDIATNKVSESEQKNVPHHLFSFLDLKDNYSIKNYQKDCRQIVEDVWSRNNIPIIVGGTGLYISAALKNYEFIEFSDAKIQKYKHEFNNKSNDKLFAELLRIDPDYANKLSVNNRTRIINALIYFLETKNLKSQQVLKKDQWFWEPITIYLKPDLEELKSKIANRVDVLVDRGLKEEVQRAYEYCGRNFKYQSMKIIGVKELVEYHNSLISWPEAVAQMVKRNCLYAKKQITWFNHQYDNQIIYSYNLKEFNKIQEEIINNTKKELKKRNLF